MAAPRRSAPRRLLAAFVVASLVAALGSGCSSSGDDADATPVEPKIVPGFDGAALHVGVLLPSAGPMAEIAAEQALGLRAYFDYATTELAGAGSRYALQLDVESAKDVAGLAAALPDLRTRTVLLAPLGGLTVERPVVDALAAVGGLAAIGDPDVTLVREPSVLPVGVSGQVAAANALAWSVDAKGGARDGAHLCRAVQDGFAASAWQAGLSMAAERLDLTVPAAVTIPASAATPSAVRAASDRLRTAGCTTVFLAASPGATRAVLSAASAAGRDTMWIVPSVSTAEVLADDDLIAYATEHLRAVGSGPTTAKPVGLPAIQHIRDLYAPGQALGAAFIGGVLLGRTIVTVLDDAVRRGDVSSAAVLADSVLRRTVDFEELAPNLPMGPAARRRPTTSATIFAPDAEAITRLRSVAPGYGAPVAADVATALLEG